MTSLLLALLLAQPSGTVLEPMSGMPVRLCAEGPAAINGIFPGVPYVPVCNNRDSLLDGLMAYYTFDGNALDSLGNYNGTAVGASSLPPPFYVTGLIGSAFSMSPGGTPITSNQFWWLSQVSMADIPLGVEWSAAGWVNFAGPTQTPDYVFGFKTGSSELQGIRANSGSVASFKFGGGTYNGNATISTGWHHIAMTYSATDNKTLRIYLDCTLDATHANVQLGAGFTDFTPNQFFNSNFDRTGRTAIGDEWGAWNRPLTQAEITRLCNGGVGRTYPFTANTPSASSLNTGLVAYYAFSNNVNDSTGSNNATSTALTYGSGIIGQAGVFDGATSYVSVPNPASFRAAQFTVAAWVKTSSAAESDVFHSWDIAGGPSYLGFELRLLSGAMRTVVGNGGFTYSAGAATNLSNNSWHHVVVVVNGTGLQAFVDGASDFYSATYAQPTYNTNNRVRIGTDEYQPGLFANFFNGSIDEVGYWSRALTAQEITLLYNNGAGRTAPF